MSFTKCLILIVTPRDGTNRTLCLFLFGGAILDSESSTPSVSVAFLLDACFLDAAVNNEDIFAWWLEQKVKSQSKKVLLEPKIGPTPNISKTLQTSSIGTFRCRF